MRRIVTNISGPPPHARESREAVKHYLNGGPTQHPYHRMEVRDTPNLRFDARNERYIDRMEHIDMEAIEFVTRKWIEDRGYGGQLGYWMEWISYAYVPIGHADRISSTLEYEREELFRNQERERMVDFWNRPVPTMIDVPPITLNCIRSSLSPKKPVKCIIPDEYFKID